MFFLTKPLRTKYILGVNCTLLDYHLLHCGSLKSHRVHIGSGMLCDGYIYDRKKQLGFSLQTIQPVVSCCTNHAILAAYTEDRAFHIHTSVKQSLSCVWTVLRFVRFDFLTVELLNVRLGCDVLMAIQHDVKSQKS